MFHYHSIEDIRREAEKEKISIPFSEHTHILHDPVCVDGIHFPNRLVIQPMEGCDGTADGRPDELTLRRYERFAKSGAGLIWEEATAIVPEGRANPRQLWIHAGNIDDFRRMNELIRNEAMKKFGWAPKIIMQATHSGRYSKPEGTPAPLIAYHNPIFEKNSPISDNCIVSDDYLQRLIERYASAAQQAEQAEFDGIDVKCCHRYLGSELLSAYERPGRFGGSFENRTRYLTESIRAVKASVKNSFLVTSRLNIYDGFPYPNGFGVSVNGGILPDLSEPQKLIGILHEQLGVQLLNITIGNPYFNPHVNRPSDFQPYELPENPLVGVARMLDCIHTIQTAYPELTIIGSGSTYLRQFAPQMVSGAIEQGYYKMAGFGRMAFAYPEFADDILSGRGLDPSKCCITCGKCTQLMRYACTSGCVIRDPIYTKLYKDVVLREGGALRI